MSANQEGRERSRLLPHETSRVHVQLDVGLVSAVEEQWRARILLVPVVISHEDPLLEGRRLGVVEVILKAALPAKRRIRDAGMRRHAAEAMQQASEADPGVRGEGRGGAGLDLY